MLIENKDKRKLISKWLVGIFTACILIYLGAGHMSTIGKALAWLFNLVFPLFLGSIFALVLNVPMRPIEKHLFRKKKSIKFQKARRPLAILLSVLLILGIFLGIAFLVIPELINAIGVVVANINSGMDQLAIMDKNLDWSQIPYGAELSKIDVDWIQLKQQLQQWLIKISNEIMDSAVSSLGSVAGSIVDFFVALVFSIYLLSNKEKLKRQVIRLINVWLPKQFGNIVIHVSSVCGETFHHFITGQATEAIILGTLCTIGMLILRLPYAPMIGSLVGVTAIVPYVGAYIGAFVGAFMIFTVNPFKALLFLIFLVILQQIEGNVIYPRVVGAKINLPAMWVLAAITVGGNLAGPAGMLLGVPAASSAYALLREATEHKEQRNKAQLKNNQNKNKT